MCCAVLSHSVMSDSLRPHGPTRFLCPRGFSRQEYWSELHALLQGIFPTQGSNPALTQMQLKRQIVKQKVYESINTNRQRDFLKRKNMKETQMMCVCVCVCVCVWSVTQYCLTLYDLLDYIAHQTPLSMELSRQEYWSGLPLPSLGNLPDPGSNPDLLHCRQILYI